jgi:phosphorylase/glycogen(starch) synthase
MTKDMLSPDYLFEVSWEVCNKVGGIHTVISTKALSLVNQFGSNYILIGPDVWREEGKNPEFEEDKKLFKAWRDKAAEEGLMIRVGRWNIAGNPIAVIVDYSGFIAQKDEIFSRFWETYKLDSLAGAWDYIEASLFGYAAGKVIESFVKFHLSIRDKTVAQFHEWMTGTGILYLKDTAPQISTIFTTHATVLGRAIAGNGQPLYGRLESYNADSKAIEFNVVAKQSLEKISAQQADCFSTVSEITSHECKQFLQKPVDIITPNGFEDTFVPQGANFEENRIHAREKFFEVAEGLMGYSIDRKATLIATSGRYEFKNKGIDLFIDALGELNKSDNIKNQIVAFILIPANHYGPRKDLLSRLDHTNQGPCDNDQFLTHNLHDPNWDPILKRINQNNLHNTQEDKVKVVFVPSYLNGDDGIFNMPYYKLLIGLDMTVFASYYEPWGYTPLESVAFHVPTITTNLAGFGLWVEQAYPNTQNAMYIAHRTDENEHDVVSEIVTAISKNTALTPDKVEQARNGACEISKSALWKNLIEHYYQAYHIALQKQSSREHLFTEKERSEHAAQPVMKFSMANEPSWKKILVQKNISEKLRPLEELTKNLWWSWDAEAIALFRSIDPDLWSSCNGNPISFLDSLPYTRMLKLEKDMDFIYRMNSVYNRFTQYMGEAPKKEKPQVAYFSMEFGLHDSLKIYSGGLGLLAGDYLKEASDQNYPMAGVGLFYRYGYFKQVLTAKGEQQASYEIQQFSQTPAHPVRDENGNWVTIHIAWPGRTLYVRLWKVMVGRIPLYLLDTDTVENNEADRSISYNLYGGDWENRLKQEIVLGIGGIRALSAVGINANLYHCNEGHAAFIGIERLRHFIMDKKLTFGEALEIVRSSTIFTTHTPVPAGHDAFEESMIRIYMGHYPDRLNISWNQFISLGRSNPDNTTEKFSMSFLAANLSQEINGVSRLHGKVSQEIFRSLYKGYAAEELHIGYVTNGVHLPTWTSDSWLKLYKETFGDDFLSNQSDKVRWEKIYGVPDAKIWKLRNEHRELLINHIKTYLKETGVKRYEDPKLLLSMSEKFDKKTLTIGFARRFATYKRAHLLFSDLDRLSRIVNNPYQPVQFVFAGKAHPNDKAGQDLIKMIVEISKRPEFLGKIIFLPNYEIGLAKVLVSGVDIWMNTPTRPLEASGTSGEKAVMNGVLHFSVLDGWWAEGYVHDAGWALLEENTYQNTTYQDQLDAQTIYNLLENEIVPQFYKRDENDVPTNWVRYIKNSIAKVAPNFTMTRMMNDYDRFFYSKMMKRSQKIVANDYDLAKEISTWKKKIARSWESIDVVEIDNSDIQKTDVVLGKEYTGRVIIDLNELDPDDIGVELVVVESKNEKEYKVVYTQEFKRDKVEGKIVHYSTKMVPTAPGTFEYGIRIYPQHPDLPHRQDMNYLTWI